MHLQPSNNSIFSFSLPRLAFTTNPIQFANQILNFNFIAFTFAPLLVPV